MVTLANIEPISSKGILVRVPTSSCAWVCLCTSSSRRKEVQMNASDAANATVRTPEGPPSFLTPLIKQPLVRYFVITGVLAFISLVMLAIHCTLEHIEKKRLLEQDRKLSFGPPPSGSTRVARQSNDPGQARKLAFPFVLRTKK